ncbi:AraC family transcriptional regulator [Paenibacillus sp. RRE4]|uniref:AraC family transcriptional regulator n=1 Tax=Paenibacillus sp. RRE4 TaxID=2962587 RepID=UPI002882789E|nr:AraC family transcriptional regulator [Paenibacillus sp. RRE4]MDT0122860.1 AraC family transcriptional regulator [Paenibacillus sp. RRE4]
MSSDYFYDAIQPELLYRHPLTTYRYDSSYHRHNAYEIYLFLQGNVHFYVDHRCYPMQRGDLLVISPEEMHRTLIVDESEYERITINLKKTYVCQLSTVLTNLLSCFDHRPDGSGNIIHLNENQLNQLLYWTRQIEESADSNRYGADVQTNAAMAQLLVLINQWFQHNSFVPQDIMPDLVRRTMEYIDNHITQNITLGKLAEEFYMNSTSVSRQFKKHTGLTLRSYILGRRIELAKLLLTDGMSITDVCFQSGFSDYANFIRSFTKIVGISPGKYMKHRQAEVRIDLLPQTDYH